MSKLLAVLFFLISSVAVAQRFESFKLNVAVGYASPIDRKDIYGNKDAGKGGLAYSLEPQYSLTNHFDIGLRVEQAFIQRPEILENSIAFKTQVKSILSGLLTVNYLIGKGSVFRPFVGGGGGYYYATQSEQQVLGAGNTILYYPLPATNKWGGMVRAGFQIFQFRLEGAYNIIENTTVQNEFTRAILRGENRYFSVKAGYTLGSGRHSRT